MEWTRIALVALLASCASAGSDDDGNNEGPPDADTSFSFPDARPFADAAPLPDAAPIVYDAAPGSADGGLFCQNSSTCGSGQCCLSLGGPGFCVPGEEVLGVCLPD